MHPYLEIGSLTQYSSTEHLIDKNVVLVKGNFRETVPTFSSFKISIDEFARFTQFFKIENQKVYNLSDGAYLEGAIPTDITSVEVDTFTLFNKESEHVNLEIFFASLSSCEFRNEDKALITYQLNEAKKLLYVIKKFQKTKHKNHNKFLEDLAQLSWKLGDMEKKTQSDLAEVYYYYFKVILSYIYDVFNTREIENYSQCANEIKALLIMQLEKIGKTFIKAFENYLK